MEKKRKEYKNSRERQDRNGNLRVHFMLYKIRQRSANGNEDAKLRDFGKTMNLRLMR